jgi:hypothetical protein
MGGPVVRDDEVMPIVLDNDGSGSGLDADTLDGRDSTAFLPGRYYVLDEETGPNNPGNANSFGAQQVTCDDGDVAISGGYDDVDRGTHVFRNRFIVSVSPHGGQRPFAWNVAWYNDSSPDPIRVWALCLDVSR